MTSTVPDSETRKERALRRLETRTPSCTACGESDWRCLERHHIAGQKHDDDSALVCRNCHRKLSDGQWDHPAGATGQDQMLAIIGHYLVGLADLFRMIADAMVRFGTWLIDQATQRPAPSVESGK